MIGIRRMAHAEEEPQRDYREALPAFINALTADMKAGSKHEIAPMPLAPAHSAAP